MGFFAADGMILGVVMKRRASKTLCVIAALALLASFPTPGSAAKSYSSGGGHSYSSSSHSSSSSSSGGSHSSSASPSHGSSGSSTHSSSSSTTRSSSTSTGGSGGSTSSGGGKTFSSGGGKSYSSGSSGGDSDRKSYTSGKSYSSGSSSSSHTFSPDSIPDAEPKPMAVRRTSASAPSSSGFGFDSAAARARREETSKADLTQFRQSQSPPASTETPRSVPTAQDFPRSSPPTPVPVSSSTPNPSYRVSPPPLPASTRRTYTSYVPAPVVIETRPTRIYNVFNPYRSRPIVVYQDHYNSFFWWWLLDRSLDERAYWAYHHRYDMDPARYQTLMATDQQLESRVTALEAQQVARDPNYVPSGLDRDLMYSDRYVTHSYSNRPTRAGAAAFWVLVVPTAAGVCALFIWLVWFKRWQTVS
jgi:hypothetical protein